MVEAACALTKVKPFTPIVFPLGSLALPNNLRDEQLDTTSAWLSIRPRHASCAWKATARTAHWVAEAIILAWLPRPRGLPSAFAGMTSIK